MAQADYIISNQTFPNTRADINSHLQAIATNNSGTSAPTTQYAGQFWIDTTSSTWTMYIHDGSDDIAFATIDTSANTVNFTDSALDVVTDTTPQLGGNLDLNSNDITGTGNINITGTGTFSGDLTVDTNTLKVDSTNNRVGIGTASPAVKFQVGQTGDSGHLVNIGVDNSNTELQIANRAFYGYYNDGAVIQGSTGKHISFHTNSGTFGANECMRIDSSGNVGINTTSPSEKLEVNGTVKATQFVGGGLNPYRNIIINGDMSIAQRGTSATGLGNGDNGYHTCDRWNFAEAGTPTFEFTQSQETDVPSGQGFAKSLKMDCTTADASLASTDYLIIQQKFEGQNLQYLKKGTSNAESLTCSFWVKSNKTGTYILELKDDNNRTINKSYTVSSADTWEKKTITYDGDTTGAFGNDNGFGLQLNFWLVAGTNYTSGTLQTSWGSQTNANRAVGQVNLADSTSNEWYITGVQLEAGTSASDFEFLPYDVNLRRCLRYYYLHMSGDNFSFGMGLNYTSTYATQSYPYPVEMRTTPSLDQVSGTNYYNFLRNGGSDNLDDFALNALTNEKYFEIYNNTDISGTAGQAGLFRGNNASAYIAFDAEL